MNYKVYNVNEEDALSIRSSTDGYQPKFLVSGGDIFLKVQCQIGKTLRDDWRVEDIASRICDQLGIYHIKQTPCKVKIKTKKGIILNRLGVASKNFEKSGYQFISYTRILEKNNIDTKSREYNSLNAIDKMKYQIDILSKICRINKDKLLRYMFDLATIDMLVLNQDRHFKNFGVFWNNISCKYETAPIFDNGMGLFENDIIFDGLSDLEDCMRYSYIAPYGEDPFELLEMLKKTKAYKNYLKSLKIKGLKLNKSLFVHPVSYEYFYKIKKQMEAY